MVVDGYLVESRDFLMLSSFGNSNSVGGWCICRIRIVVENRVIHGSLDRLVYFFRVGFILLAEAIKLWKFLKSGVLLLKVKIAQRLSVVFFKGGCCLN